jgi:hypothetical protein
MHARCRHPGPYGKPVARVGHDHERGGLCTHGVTGWLSERGAGAGSRIPSAITPPPTRHIIAGTNIARFNASFRSKKSSPKRVQPESNREPSKWMQVIQVRAAENLAMTRETTDLAGGTNSPLLRF